MTTGLWNATIGEAQGAVTPPADLAKYAVVIGCTSSGNTGLKGPYSSASQIVSACGYGDTCDTAAQIVTQRQTNGSQVPKVPVCIYEVPAATPGAYGTIDIASVTGTCRPAVDSGAPYGTFKAWVKIVTGCTVGSAGGTYRVSLVEEPDWSSIAAKRLGTATTIAIAGSGAGFVLEPAAATVTALYTKINTFKGAMEGTGHFTIVTGSPAIHAAEDTADDTALAAIPDATTNATAVTLFNGIRTLLGTHGASAVYHAGADATLAAALLLIPAATNVADVDLYLDSLIAAYSAHITNTTSVHGSADSTNTITAYTPIPGTLVAGDVWSVRTTAPQPSTTAIDDAYTALSRSTKVFSLAVNEYDMTPTLAAHVTTGLNTCLTTNRIMTALGHTRVPTWATSETESAWAGIIEGLFPVGTVDDSRICLFSSYAYETDARTTDVRLRAGFAQFCADVVRVEINEPPCSPNDQPAAGLLIRTAADVQVGHDEGPMGTVTGLSNADMGNRFVSTVATADPFLGTAVHYTVPWTLASATDQIKTLPMRRTADAIKRDAQSAAIGAGGTLLDYTAPDPSIPGDTYHLTDVSRGALHGVIYDAISEKYAALVSNADNADPETGFVWINPAITVAAGKLVSVEYEIRCQFKGVLVTLAGTFVTKE